MTEENLFAALDIGESTTKLVVGTKNMHTKRFTLCGTYMTPTMGYANGEVTSKNDLERTIINVIAQAEENSIKITKLILVVPSFNMQTVRRNSRIITSSSNQIVNQRDIEELERSVAYHHLGRDEVPVELYPVKYIVDGAEYEESPLGVKGNEIFLDTFVCISPKQMLTSIVDVIRTQKIETLAIIPAPVALANAIARDEERHNGIVIADIGANYTGVSAFSRNVFCVYSQFASAGSLITKGLMELLGGDKEQAEEVKKTFSGAYASESTPLPIYYNKNKDEKISERDIVKVVEESLNLIGKDLRSAYLSVAAEQELKVLIAGGVSNIYNISRKFGEFLPKASVRKLEIVGGNDSAYYCAIGAIITHLRNIGEEVNVNLINL